jgi:beta-lactam-binding protein with PASTA domain
MEIKQTVLPPYGGSREEMGGGASAWTYGRGVIGSPAEGVVVPNLIGLTASEALQALENVGLVANSSTRTSGATEGNDGTVASQSPNAGTLVNAGSTVAYAVFDYVSNLVAVPNLIGLSSSAAQNLLISIGLNWGETPPTTIGATEQNDNTVASQSISAGTLVNPGTTVVYYLFDYVEPDLATVPNIVGLTQQQAEAAISNAGLVVDTVYTSTDGATSSNSGSVKEQVPAAGTEVPQGSGVTFVVYEYLGALPYYGPTGNWGALEFAEGQSYIRILSGSYPDQDPEWADIIANPELYKIVIENVTGGGTFPAGSFEGEYLIGYASATGPTSPGITYLDLYLDPNGSSGGSGYSIANAVGGSGTINGMWSVRTTDIGGTVSIDLIDVSSENTGQIYKIGGTDDDDFWWPNPISYDQDQAVLYLEGRYDVFYQGYPLFITDSSHAYANNQGYTVHDFANVIVNGVPGTALLLTASYSPPGQATFGGTWELGAQIPDLLGYSEQDAIASLQGAGLNPVFGVYLTNVYSPNPSTELFDKVWNTTPSAYSIVASGSNVEYNIQYWVPPTTLIQPTTSWWTSNNQTIHIENVSQADANTIINAPYGIYQVQLYYSAYVGSASYNPSTSVLTLNMAQTIFDAGYNGFQRGETSTTYPVGESFDEPGNLASTASVFVS